MRRPENQSQTIPKEESVKLNLVVKKHSKKTLIVAAVVAAAAAGLGTLGAGLAAGSIPAANGTITGCYNPNAGVKNLSVIDPSTGATCPGGDTQITFDQTGPQGPVGATGPAGSAGPQGPAPCPSASSASPTVVGAVTITYAAGEGIPGGADKSNLYCFDQTTSFETSLGSASGGAGAGKPTLSTLSITKEADAASVHLFNELTSGTAITKVNLVLYHPGTTTVALAYQFEPVKATSDEMTVVDNTPLEKVTFIFADFRVATAGTSSAGWNQITNQPDPFTP
jgi:type VI protein secretion system component Hcp